MAENFPVPGEQKLTPPLTPVEAMIDAVKADDAAAFALANTYYIDAVYPEAEANHPNEKIYTEVHQVGDQFVIAPSVDGPLVHWATVSGFHSMLDGTPPGGPKIPARALERALADDMGLDSESIVAKGELSLTPEGTYALQLGHVRTVDRSYDWVGSFSNKMQDYPNFSTTYKPIYEKTEQSLDDGVVQNLRARIDPRTVRLPEAVERPGIVSGIVTGVDYLEVPKISKNALGEFDRRGELGLAAREGRTAFHQPVYEALGIKRPAMFSVKMGDLEQQLSIHYTIDKANGLSNVLVIYNNAPQTDSQAFTDLQTMVRAAMKNYVRTMIPDEQTPKYTEHFEQTP